MKLKSLKNHFLYVIVAGFILRILSVSHSISRDEVWPKRVISSMDFSTIFFAKGAGHPPFYIWMNWLFSLILGISVETFRFTSLVFGMLSIMLTYLIVKKQFNKKTALFSTIIIAFSAWHVIFASTQIHIDGPFLTFLYLLMIYLFLKFEENKSTKTLFFLGLIFGLTILTKFSAIIFIAAIYAYYLYKTRSFKSTVKPFSIIAGMGILILAVFTILQNIFYKASISSLAGFYIFRKVDLTLIQKAQALLLEISLAYIFGLVFFLMLLILFFKNFRQKLKPAHIIYYSWILNVVIFHFFVLVGYTRSFERYLVVLIVPIAVLFADYLQKFKLTRKNFYSIIILGISFLGLFFGINASGGEIIPLEPKEVYIHKLVSFDWDFYIPIVGNAGPTGFYLSFLTLFVASLLAGILTLSILFFKKMKYLKIAMILFLALALGYNLFLIEEHSFSLSAPNVNSATERFVSYATDNIPQKSHIYTLNDMVLIDYFDNSAQLKIGEIKTEWKNFELLINNFPKYAYSAEERDFIEQNCALKHEETDKKETIFYHYSCTTYKAMTSS